VAVARRARTLGQLDRADRQMAMLALVLGAASAISIRNAPFFALVAVPAVSRLIGSPIRQARRRPAGAGAMTLLALAGAAAGIFVVRGWRDGGTRLEWRPINATAVRSIQSCPAPVFNTYYAGGVLLWFVPEQRVFIDGRVEVYPVPLLERSRRADLAGEYQELFTDYRIRCAVVPTNSPMSTALSRDPSAQRLYADSEWAVFIMQQAAQ
jgi:hypothetical protein